MPKYIRKPFDLQKALAGARVVTRDGLLVVEFAVLGGEPVVRLGTDKARDIAFEYRRDGTSRVSKLLDLFIEEEVKEEPLFSGQKYRFCGRPRVLVRLPDGVKRGVVPIRWLMINPDSGDVGGLYEDDDVLRADIAAGVYKRQP